MAEFRGVVTQSGADTTTSVSIDTGITLDGKTGLSILTFRAYWSNGEVVAAADSRVTLQLNTVTGAVLFSSNDCIDYLAWGVQNTAGVAVALPYEPVKDNMLFEPRVTAQPLLYVTAQTANTAQANTFYYRIGYEPVKLTDLEIMRLLVGGA